MSAYKGIEDLRSKSAAHKAENARKLAANPLSIIQPPQKTYEDTPQSGFSSTSASSPHQRLQEMSSFNRSEHSLYNAIRSSDMIERAAADVDVARLPLAPLSSQSVVSPKELEKRKQDLIEKLDGEQFHIDEQIGEGEEEQQEEEEVIQERWWNDEHMQMLTEVEQSELRTGWGITGDPKEDYLNDISEGNFSDVSESFGEISSEEPLGEEWQYSESEIKVFDDLKMILPEVDNTKAIETLRKCDLNLGAAIESLLSGDSPEPLKFNVEEARSAERSSVTTTGGSGNITWKKNPWNVPYTSSSISQAIGSKLSFSAMARSGKVNPTHVENLQLLREHSSGLSIEQGLLQHIYYANECNLEVTLDVLYTLSESGTLKGIERADIEQHIKQAIRLNPNNENNGDFPPLSTNTPSIHKHTNAVPSNANDETKEGMISARRQKELLADSKVLRDLATAEAQNMQKIFKRASTIHSRLGRVGGSAALHIVEEGRASKSKTLKLQAQAAQMAFQALNPHVHTIIDGYSMIPTGWSSKGTDNASGLTVPRHGLLIDLHNLHVAEALKVVSSIIELATTGMKRVGESVSTICFVTGMGKHSTGGCARLRPAVGQHLKAKNLPTVFDGQGAYIVQIQ